MMPMSALGEAERARSQGVQALKLYRALEIPDRVCITASNLGYVELLLDSFTAAKLYFREALEISVGLGLPRDTAYSLLGLAATQADGDNGSNATRLIGASEQMLQTLGVTYEATRTRSTRTHRKETPPELRRRSLPESVRRRQSEAEDVCYVERATRRSTC